MRALDDRMALPRHSSAPTTRNLEEPSDTGDDRVIPEGDPCTGMYIYLRIYEIMLRFDYFSKAKNVRFHVCHVADGASGRLDYRSSPMWVNAEGLFFLSLF